MRDDNNQSLGTWPFDALAGLLLANLSALGYGCRISFIYLLRAHVQEKVLDN